MKRGAKRASREGEEVPGARSRTKDAQEMQAAEEEARRQRELSEQRRRKEEAEAEEDSWEDDDDAVEGDVEEGDFIEDEEDEEEEIIEASDDDDEYAEFQKESSANMTKGIKSISFRDAGLADGEEEAGGAGEVSVWRGDIEEAAVAEGGEGGAPMKLEFSNKAYDAFFQLRTEYPCLSFDVVKDNKDNHTKYPLSTLLVCGTQADDNARNELLILHVTNMCRTKYDVASDNESEEEDYIGDEGDSDDDDDDEAGEEVNDGEPVVHHRAIKHYGTANRVRCCPQNNPSSGSQLVAVWSDAGHVQVFDIESDVRALTDFSNWSKEQAQAWKKPERAGQKKAQPLKFCTPSTSHKTEGYGLDWSPVQSHVFASGDCAGALFVWQPTEDGRWKNAASSTVAGAMSIEEIQWSPTQADVLITTRAGGVVEVWDTRDMRTSKINFQADPTDINVADWNRARQASHLLVTGAESGAVAVWDLRRIAAASDPIQRIALHKKAITSVEFAPHNESVLSVVSDDGRCTLWDLSLERDANEEQEAVGELFSGKLKEYPDQLMFQHQGLVHPKEAHWHMQIPGLVVTTDYEGLNLFRPMNWKSLMR
jgi:ribosome assembly protein RRB1